MQEYIYIVSDGSYDGSTIVVATTNIEKAFEKWYVHIPEEEHNGEWASLTVWNNEEEVCDLYLSDIKEIEEVLTYVSSNKIPYELGLTLKAMLEYYINNYKRKVMLAQKEEYLKVKDDRYKEYLKLKAEFEGV